MTTTVIKKAWPIAALDIFALAMVYFMPALAHLTAIPFYIIEPFRLMILVSLVVMNSKHNALLLAVTLPLFSFIIASHPLFAKAMLISIEMIFNVLVYSWLIKKINKPFWVILISIIVSKAGYYLLKYGFISMGLLSMSLISTSLLVQLAVAVVTALLFGQIYKLSK